MKSRFWGEKIIFTTLLTMFLLVSLFFPKGVQAQFVVTDIPHLLMQGGKWVAEKTWDLLQYAWKYGGAIAYRNALNLYLGQMAEQTAEYVATGGKGQKPMFMTDPDYWSKMGDQVLGEWIDQTAKSFTGFTGKSLCDPIDPTIKFNMLIGMDKKYQGMMFSPEMRCSFSTIKKRLKEASKKKLFDFSIELKEGKAARYRRELAHQVEGEPSLVAGVKEKILIFAKDLSEKDEVFRQNVEALKKIQEGAKSYSSSALASLKANWEEALLEAQEQREAFQQTSLAKAAACHAKDKDAFCKDDYCLSLCSETYTEEECKTNFGYCTAAAKKTADFFNRTLDWSNESIAGVKDILDNFADFEPTPPPTLEDINRDYNPEASDVAVMFKIESELFKKQTEAIEKSKFMQGLTGDINRLTTKISNLTLTPGSGIRATYEESIRKGSAGPIEYTGVAVADAIGIFTNTLFTKLLKQAFDKGLNPAVSPEIVERTTPFLTKPDEFVAPTQEESSVLYADLAVASIKRGNEISIYDEFAVCPEDKKYALPTNCLIDNKLVRAIEEKLTIQQAMEKTPTSLLDPGQIVGKPGDYNSLLSWTNVKKLRRVRIFPLGLEIAAKKLFNRELGDVEMSLQEIVNAFDNDNPNNEFYHLVDPNWVLKATTYQCGAMGYSSIPMAGSTHRQESCLDLKDCINEDEDGQCDTWAYCTREKNIWRMNGTKCDAQYASCQTYQKTSDKSQTAYLTNTLDFSDCDQNNAGCKWYCSNWDENLNEGSWACVEPGESRQVGSDVICSLGSPCTSQDGCLCTDATGSCLVANTQTTCAYPVYVEYADADNSIFFNNKVEECSEQDVGCHEYIRTVPGLGTNLIFNGSFELDTDVDGNPDGWDDPGWEGLEIKDTNYYLDGDVSYKFIHTGADEISDYTGLWQVVQVIPGQEYTISARIKVETAPSDATINYYFDDDGVGYIDGNQGETTVILDGSETNWQRHAQTITIPADRFYVWIAPIIYGDGVVYFDNIKFETGETASSYRYYGEINKIYLKDALSCSIDEVGCELYTPSNGDPLVPGVIKNQDKCSFSCLGYETFQQMPSHFDANSPQWVNLIPSSAEACATPGCEEFTNLDTEDLEHYSYLRQCVKTNTQGEAVINSDGTSVNPPNADLCQQYYTWVGTETGYQLKQYYLKKASQQYTGDPDANGPTKVSLTPDIEWGECQDIGDALVNPHCRQFYDASGNIYYRLYKNTISCTETCSLYRRSVDQTTQMADVSEAEACPKQDVGCLEHKGPTAGNIFQVFLDDFEDENIGEWSSGINVSESVNFPGHSLNVSSGSTSRSVANLVYKNRTYFVSFWIKGTGNIDVSFDSLSTVSKTGLNPGEWQEVKLGPFYFDVEPDEAEELTIENGSFYLDNIILKEIQDDIYLIKDSWETPCECDTLDNHEIFSTGALRCYAEDVADVSMVGCQAYQDRGGQGHYLKSFTQLCLESVVGCESLIDTQNSTWALSQTFNAGDPVEDNVTILADELIYLVNDEEKECDEQNKGCQKLGLPTLNIDQEVVFYTDIYLVNNPDSYTNEPTLCLREDLGCEEYEGQFYFRDPGNKVCEYREDVAVGIDSSKTGWFKKDTNQACYYNSNGEPYEPNEVTYGIRLTNDSEYDGWVGLCPKAQSGCTEFIDPLGQNLSINGGLEIDSNNDNMPDGYVANEGTPIMGGMSTESHTGSWSYKVDVPSAGKWYGLYSDGIEVFPNREYTISAYVKTENISATTGTPKVGLRLHCHNNSGHSGGNGHFTRNSGEEFITTSNQDWTYVWLTFTTNSDTDHCHILPTIYRNDYGIAYFDNIKLIELLSNRGKYHYLNNEKLDKSSCQYRAGLKQGCVLFNDTSQSSDSLIYDSAGSYAASVLNNDLLTTAETTNPGQGDANIAIKVSRDRVCGEWLSCIGSRVVWDRSTGSYREECEFVGRCDDLVGSGESAQCGHIVYHAEPKLLDQDLYQSRDVSWAGMDYSGHSLYNMYPIERLYVAENPPTSGIYQVTFDGVDGDGVDGQGTNLDKSCQIFPEKDSPFPQSVAGEGHEYPDANICSEDGGTGSYTDCQCSYVKAEYSGMVKYYNYDSTPDDNICVSVGLGSGKKVGDSCTTIDGCGTGGSCSAQTKETEVIGVRGWCLEKDPSKPDDINACITWWPGPSIGDPDIQYQAAEAGRTLGTDTYYCLHTQSRTTEQDRFFCLSNDGSGNCDEMMRVPANSKMATADEASMYLNYYRTDLSTVTEVAGESLGTNREAILTSGTVLTVDSFPGGLVDETGLKAAYVPPGAHKMWKYGWDVKTWATVRDGTDTWCGCIDTCGGYHNQLSCPAGDWREINHDCWRADDKCTYDWSICDERKGWMDCNPGTYPYYVSPESGYLQSALSSCPNDGCLQYCDALVMAPAQGTLATDRYYQWKEVSPSVYNSDLLACQSGQTSELGITKRCGHDYYWPDGGGSSTSLCYPFSKARQGTLNEKIPVGTGGPEDDGYYNCNAIVGANHFFSCGAECKSGVSPQSASIAANKVDDLFRKFDIYNWGGSNYAYSDTWDATSGGVFGEYPKVGSVTCNQANECEMNNENKITIGGLESGNIERSQTYPAILKFYAWADKDHMPIKEIVVEWTDTQVTGQGSWVKAKNHKDVCVGPDFANIDDSCTEEFHINWRDASEKCGPMPCETAPIKAPTASE